MEISKENHKSKALRRNYSDSEIVNAQRLCVIPDEEDLRIVGFRVKLNDEHIYSFDLGKLKSKSDDVLTISTHSNKLKLTPQSKDFEAHVMSNRDTKDATSEDKSLSTSSDYCASEDERVTLSIEHRNLVKLPVISLEHVAEMSTQTDQEIELSIVQTEIVKVLQPMSVQAVSGQPDKTRDILTATEEKETKPVETQTDAIAKKQIPVQTDKEMAAGSSQTEAADIYSIDRVYAASTQTEQAEDAGTSTDFNIYIVDRENVAEKAVDTRFLPFESLIVECEGKSDEVVGKEFGEQECHCFCGHRNHRKCIFKCCLHKDFKDTELESLTKCPFQQFATYSSATRHCNHCHCPPTTNYSVISKCDENFRMDLHQLHCCRCAFDSKTRVFKQLQEATEGLKAPECIRIDKVDFNSIAAMEKIDVQSQVEIAKNLKNAKLVAAERVVQPSKVEVVSVLQFPVVFEHYLTSFDRSSCRPSRRVVVNPIDITLSGNGSGVFGKSADAQLETNANHPIDECLEDTSEKNILKSLDDKTNKKSVRFCLTPPQPMISAVDNKQPQLSPCNECHSNVYGVVENKRICELYDSVKGVGMTPEAQRNSTSPKIKHRNFNYTSKDTWKPYDRTSSGVLDKRVEATDIIHVGESSSEEFFESKKDIGFNEACEVVNNHFLNLRPVDENEVKKAAEFLHKRWFETAGSKYSDVMKVRNYMQYTEKFSPNLIKALLHSVDNNGNNVLHFAFANNRFDLAEEILGNAFGADLLKETNKIGNSPLSICSISEPKSSSDWATVSQAFGIGGVDSKTMKGGQTALMNASSCGFHAMVDLLLDAGADPNLQDKDGSTALMYAAEHGRETCVKRLLEHMNCDFTIRDKDGQKACSIALSNRHENLAVLIHDSGLEKRKQSKDSHCSRRYIWTDDKPMRRPEEKLCP